MDISYNYRTVSQLRDDLTAEGYTSPDFRLDFTAARLIHLINAEEIPQEWVDEESAGVLVTVNNEDCIEYCIGFTQAIGAHSGHFLRLTNDEIVWVGVRPDGEPCAASIITVPDDVASELERMHGERGLNSRRVNRAQRRAIACQERRCG